MHLLMSYTTPEGVVYPSCCIVISAIIVSPDNGTICTNFFADVAAWQEGALPLAQPAFAHDLTLWDTGPIMTVTYNHLLTLPEFAGATLVDPSAVPPAADPGDGLVH